MKKLGLYMCLGLASVALSCTEGISPFGKEGVMELTFIAGTGQTRSMDPRDDEEEINSLQVFLFSADSLLESEGYSGTNTVVLRCSKGDKIAYAVTNYDELSWWEGMTVSDLMGTVVKLSEENWNVMVGNYAINDNVSGLVPLDSSDEMFPVTPNTISIGVKRIAARVVLSEVINDSKYDTNGSTDVWVLSACLTNAMGDAELSAVFSEDYSHETEVWYNRCGDEGDLESILSNEIVGIFLHGGGELAGVEEYLYCFPNPTESDSTSSFTLGDDGVSSDWIPRYTRLVVEATYGGEHVYYPISIEGIRSNCSYQVTLIITQKGSSDPEGHSGGVAHMSLSASSAFDVSGEYNDGEGSFIPIVGGYVRVRECRL